MGLIKPTEKFVLVVSSLAGAIMMLYLFNFILMLFGTTVPFLQAVDLSELASALYSSQ